MGRVVRLRWCNIRSSSIYLVSGLMLCRGRTCLADVPPLERANERTSESQGSTGGGRAFAAGIPDIPLTSLSSLLFLLLFFFLRAGSLSAKGEKGKEPSLHSLSLTSPCGGLHPDARLGALDCGRGRRVAVFVGLGFVFEGRPE